MDSRRARVRQGTFIPPQGEGDVAVPKETRRRLLTVLRHLDNGKANQCTGHIAQDPCSSATSMDIEDLAHQPHQCKTVARSRLHCADVRDDAEDALFDPDRYAATQKPLLEASTLPSEPYSSRKWFERELARVFGQSWLLVGRADEIEAPGQYIALDTEWFGPIVVCRGKDGGLYAFANVCRHRGAKVVPDGKGKASPVGLICPYHAWTYDYDGKLKWAPGMNESKDFDEDDVRLKHVRLETFCGFIFVNASDSKASLADQLGDLADKAPIWFGPEGKVNDMVCAARREYDVPCNWKLLMENTCETYHTSVVHKGSLGPMKSSPVAPHLGDWDGVTVYTERSVVPLPDDFEGVQFPLPAFTDSTTFINLFPSLQMNVTWDCMWWMLLIPTSESSTRVQMGFVFPKETIKLDYFPSTLERYLHRWHTAVQEDNAISLNQARGVRSILRVPGRFSKIEFGTHNFNNWLLSKMLDGQVSTWDPGSRAFFGKDDAWSNKDKHMLMLASESEKTQNQAKNPLGPNAVSGIALRNGPKVCVTGATGFIGLHVVKLLLDRGCHVLAAVRDASNEQKMAPLLTMQRSAGTGVLELLGGCEVLSAGSYDAAVADAVVCFHLASPFWMDDRITDPQAQLIAPAEQGTINVLTSCAKSKHVRRVVITSSFGAVMNVGGRTPWPMDFHYSEKHWNESSAPVDGVFPEPINAHAYRWSKTCAEKAAYDFVDAHKPRFDISCILPPMVLGPNMQRLTSDKDLNQSSLILFKMLAGQMPHANPGSVGFVDVRDVAMAHVLAGETESAGGQRYLCSGVTKTWLEVAGMLRQLFPGRPVPSTCADGSTTQPCLTLDNSKIRAQLGMDFTPLEETLQAQGRAFLEASLLQ